MNPIINPPMTEWKKYRIKDISKKINSGGTPKSSEKSFYDGTIPWLNTKEIDFNRIRKTERCITDEGFANSSAKWIPKGSVIVAMYGATAAKVAYSLIDLTTNQACCNIIVDDTIADSQFVYYYIQSSYQELLNLACGAAQQNLSLGVIADFPILLPPLDTQRRIAAILSSLDDKIDLLHRENATLEQMAETLFRQWFVVESKEEWEEGKLGDILTVKGGTTPSTKEPSYWDGDIAWTSPRDVTTLKGLYLFETEKRITQKGLEQISSGLLPAGTLLMSSRAPVGVLAFAEIPLAINQGYIAILDDKGYPKEFIYLWLKANMDLVHSYSNGSTFMEISKSAFKSLDIVIPSKNEVESFVQEVKPYFEKIRTNEIQIRTLTKTRDGLLPKLMNNEINI